MAESMPLLSIVVPTWNRAGFLSECFEALLQQELDPAEIEIIVADNASTDDTPAVVQRFAGRLLEKHGIVARSHRHPENIGSDANFIFSYHAARGRYFWLFSDDDILVPGAVSQVLSHLRRDDFDIVYVTSYGFQHDWRAERCEDPYGRHFHTIRSARTFAKTVNTMITFISGIVVHKERLESLPHEDPAGFQGTNLVQLSWTLPLLRQHRQSLVLWERLVAGRLANSGGYSLGEVFGRHFVENVNRCLPDRPSLARIFINFSVRRWFPEFLYEQRTRPGQTYDLDRVDGILGKVHRNNFRYWLFTWPVLKLPLPFAKQWYRGGKAVSKLVYLVQLPGFWRKRT